MAPAGMMKSEEMAPDEAAGLSKGYCVRIHVLPDGSYSVGGPEPLMMEGMEGEEYPSIGAALKQVLAVIQQNPIGGDANKEFEAGYAAR